MTAGPDTSGLYSNEIWKELLGEGDADDDGEITFEEFKVMMQKMLNKGGNEEGPIPITHNS